MRYLVALIIGIGALFGVNYFADLFSMPRPWNSLSMGATVGITMVVVLLIWEVVKPTHKDSAPAKPAMSEEERANARAERRSRLAAEAGVSLDDNDGVGSTSTTSAGDGAESGSDAESDESSIEAEPDEGDDLRNESNDAAVAQDEPETLAPDEFDEDATGSSLENPPTGEPGVSVDALEDAESADADGAPDDGHVDDEPTAEGPDSKR